MPSTHQHPTHEDPPPATVRLGAGPDLAAAVPHLLGFPPRQSLVLVALTGSRRRRVGVTLRVDLPPAGAPDVVVTAVAQQAVATLGSPAPAGAVVLVFTDEAPERALPRRGLVHAVLAELVQAGCAPLDAMLVRGGRCWSYECAAACCDPQAGVPLPGGTSPLAATAAFSGQVLAGDRAELVDRLRPVEGEPAREVVRACSQAANRAARLLLQQGPELAAEVSWQHVLDAVARCAPGPVHPLPAADVARVGWALADTAVRDRALALGLGPDAAAAEALWTELTRRLPVPLDAPAATLLAVTVWARGDGAMANVALDRALGSRPDYPLAGLLRTALDAALPPAELRRLVASACTG